MDTTQRYPYDWHSFPHISVNLSKSFGASVLQIIDYIEGVVLINDHSSPDANIIRVRKTELMY